MLAGHSMGAHTLTAFALSDARPRRGDRRDRADLARRRDRRRRACVTGTRSPTASRAAASTASSRPTTTISIREWRETILRITRERLERHRHLDAVARALREVPASRPFDDLSELEFLDVPALVVASHDEADPGHPYAAAEAWADRLPQATLVSEEPGASPLAWQGGRLSRAIAAFCEEPAVAERLSA